MPPPTPDTPPSLSSYFDTSFSDWLTPFLHKYHVPGLSIALISGTSTHSAAYGLARLPSTPAKPSTLYPMCSTTKAFTCALLGLLIEEAQSDASSPNSTSSTATQPTTTTTTNKGLGIQVLTPKGWRTPVSTIIPSYFITSSPLITHHTTLQDLASHRSGIPGHDFLWGPWCGGRLSQNAHAVRHLEAAEHIEGRWRTDFQYNNMMYGVLGYVIEVITGQSYAEVMKERLFGPLGMHDTYGGMAESLAAVGGEKERWCRGYYWRGPGGGKEVFDSPQASDDSKKDEEKGYYIPERWHDLCGIEPAGALVSTVEDYAKWVIGMLAGAKAAQAEASKSSSSPSTANNDDKPNTVTDKPVISPSLYTTLTTPSISMGPNPYPSPYNPLPPSAHSAPQLYALGWNCDPTLLPGENVIQHGGGMPGIATMVAFLPAHDFGLVLATNSAGGNVVNECVMREVLGRRCGWSEEQRRAKIDGEKKDNAAKKDEKKAEDVTTAEAKEKEGDIAPPLNTTTTTDGDTNVETVTTATPPTRSPFDDLDINALYHHPAYGTFHFSLSTTEAGHTHPNPTYKGEPIMRPNPEPTTTSSYTSSDKSTSAHDTSRNAATAATATVTAPIVATALGRRGLMYRLLLHPAPKQQYEKEGRIVCGWEEILNHGDMSEDAFPGLDHGWGTEKQGLPSTAIQRGGKGNEEEKAQKKALYPGPGVGEARSVWEGGKPEWGAGVVVVRDAGEGKGKGRWVERIGMRLGRVDGKDKQKEGEEGVLQEGWEGAMIWWERVLES